MAHASQLPEEIAGKPFSIAAARGLGVTPQRLRAADLVVPFRGVRAPATPASAVSAALAFAQRMRPGHVFAGVTAARLWGLPVASFWSPAEKLVIGVPAGTTRTRVHAVRTREFDPARLACVELDGLPLLAPVATVMSMAKETSQPDLVVLLDALVTDSKRYPGLRVPQRPHAEPATLAAFAARCRGLHGASAFAAAVGAARVGADSPQETRTRLAIVGAGLPEPVLQHEIWHDGQKVATVDLAYPRWKIAIEYEGEGHRVDAAQWAKDIARYERLDAHGWLVIRVTKGDLRGDARALTERVRDAIGRRCDRP